jgi:hypothetical protein
MLITLYCNPFFAPCKEKIYQIPRFFQNIFKRLPKKRENFGKTFPKRGKQRTQKAAEGTLPKEDPGEQCQGIAHPQIAAAKAKHQINPGPEEEKDKQKVSQPARAKGTQKPI